MSNPLVSIIIPTFNRAQLIGETLDSVLEQTYTNWECIVVDDGSRDGTVGVLESYLEKDSRFKYYTRSDDRSKGANACRNIGVEKSLGAYFMFLDSDDLLAIFCLGNRVKTAINNANTKIFVFKMQRFTKVPGDSTAIVNTYFKDKEAYLLNFLSYNLPWPITVLFLKRETKIVQFNEDLQRLQDVEYSIKLLFKFNNIDLKIIESLDSDCFYRIADRSRLVSVSLIKKIASSLLVYLKSIEILINQVELSKKRRYREANYIFFIKIYELFLLNNIRDTKKEVKLLKKHLLFSKYINYIFYLKLSYLELLYLFKLNKVKGIGVYRLTKLWIK